MLMEESEERGREGRIMEEGQKTMSLIAVVSLLLSLV